MLDALYSLPFAVLEVPNLKLKKPTWIQKPSAMKVYAMVLFSYFLVTGGKLKHLIWMKCIVTSLVLFQASSTT